MIATIGTIMLASIFAREFSSNLAYIDENSVQTFEFPSHGTTQVEQQVSSIIINKKGVFKGTGNDRTDIVNSLRSAINKLATPLPANFGSLCTNVNANV